MPNKKSSRGFTLIELLIVIAIIGILMALLFPAVGAAIDAARKTQAKNDVTQIATAVTAYETEYGYLPYPPTDGPQSADKTYNADSNGIIGVLMGTGTANNPRKIVFLEVANVANKNGKSGLNSDNKFVDPWKNVYQIALDYDYDNSLAVTYGSDTGASNTTVNLRKKVAVFNLISSGSDKTKTNYYRRSVYSW